MGCKSLKYAFSSNKSAQNYVNQHRNEKNFKALHTYKCKCGSWHLTSKPQGNYAYEAITRELERKWLVA